MDDDTVPPPCRWYETVVASVRATMAVVPATTNHIIVAVPPGTNVRYAEVPNLSHIVIVDARTTPIWRADLPMFDTAHPSLTDVPIVNAEEHVL